MLGGASKADCELSKSKVPDVPEVVIPVGILTPPALPYTSRAGEGASRLSFVFATFIQSKGRCEGAPVANKR